MDKGGDLSTLKLAHLYVFSYTSFTFPPLFHSFFCSKSSSSLFLAILNSQLTPLQVAAATNKVKVVSSLTSHGADVNAREDYGETPLMKASFTGHAKVVEALLDAGADKELKATSGRREGKTALDIARDACNNANKGDVVAVLERR